MVRACALPAPFTRISSSSVAFTKFPSEPKPSRRCSRTLLAAGAPERAGGSPGAEDNVLREFCSRLLPSGMLYKLVERALVVQAAYGIGQKRRQTDQLQG